MKDHEGLFKARSKNYTKVKLWWLEDNSYQHLMSEDWLQLYRKENYSNLSKWWKDGKKHKVYQRVGPVEVGKW